MIDEGVKERKRKIYYFASLPIHLRFIVMIDQSLFQYQKLVSIVEIVLTIA